MIKKIKGQAALILILLAAAGLIFFAITLNWGRVTQTKSSLTIAANQAAATLASSVASFGEMQKTGNLEDKNKKSSHWAALLSWLTVVAAIAALFIPGLQGIGLLLVQIGVGVAAANLALQLAVVNPMISSLYNKLQKDQPTQQQFFEQGISAALQGAVTDQVNITDYLDWNANGIWGNNATGYPNDIVGRFALFYGERLKMLNQPPIPQVVNFYNQLGALMKGGSGTSNSAAPYNYPVPLNDTCQTDPGNPKYSPYCDPCCQPLTVDGKPVRPSSCADQSPVPAQCFINNPYNSSVGANDSPYPLLYDPAYQNYASKLSFLDQFGRDQQAPLPGPPPEPPFTPLTIQGDFPNGIYPFFWLAKTYSLEVDNIDPTSTPITPGNYHWCTNALSAPAGYVPLSGAVLAEFPDLNQLTLPYTSPDVCQGKDCCVNYLGGSIKPGSITTTNPNGVLEGGNVPALPLVNNVIDMVGSSNSNLALNQSFGEGGSGTWLEGDNQFCSTAWPYNGADQSIPDGKCEWTNNSTALPTSAVPDANTATVDGLDDTMHALSDFVKFSNDFLNKDLGTLSSTFSTWYPQAAQWIAPACPADSPDNTCNPDQDGRLLSAYNNLTNWAGQNGQPGVVTNWLNNTYANSGAWCVPPDTTGMATTEVTAINGGGSWGTMPSVIACLNYNAATPAGLYNQCLTGLTAQTTPYQCALPDPSCKVDPTLGRSLAGAAPCFSPGEDTSTPTLSTCGTGKLCHSDPPVTPPAVSCATVSCAEDCHSPQLGNKTTTTTTNHCCNTCQTCSDCTLCGQDPPTCNTCSVTDCTLCGQNPDNSCKTCSVTDCTLCGSTPGACHSCGANCDICGCTADECSVNTITDVKYNSADCDPAVAGSYANWVQNSATLATNEASKFALRAQYLQDVYTRAQNMQNIFSQGDADLQQFFAPCSGNKCSGGGPAAQLIYAQSQPSPTALLPNSVIYGWVDAPPSGGSGGCTDSNGKRVGCSHIVKVTAYSPGRSGSPTRLPPPSPPWRGALPQIKRDSGLFTLSYTLKDRDGYVYVSIKRWDEEHSNPVNFPNGRPLWQFMFHNPKTNSSASTGIGGGSLGSCGGLGQTVTGLNSVTLSLEDKTALANAFMLNDKGDGKVDAQGTSNAYGACLQEVDALLGSAPESHACAQYIASSNASGASGDDDSDYSVKFVNCPSIPQEDL